MSEFIDQTIETIDMVIEDRRIQLERLQAARAALTPNGPQTQEPAKVTGRTRRQSGATREAVIAAVKQAAEPVTARDVAQITGLGQNTVGTTLSKLGKDGALRKVPRGYTAG